MVIKDFEIFLNNVEKLKSFIDEFNSTSDVVGLQKKYDLSSTQSSLAYVHYYKSVYPKVKVKKICVAKNKYDNDEEINEDLLFNDDIGCWWMESKERQAYQIYKLCNFDVDNEKNNKNNQPVKFC